MFLEIINRSCATYNKKNHSHSPDRVRQIKTEHKSQQ